MNTMVLVLWRSKTDVMQDIFSLKRNLFPEFIEMFYSNRSLECFRYIEGIVRVLHADDS